jgi:hypothetical protein
MAGDKPTLFDYETLTALSGRLHDHAEDISATLEFEPVLLDLKLAAQACSRFASLRFRIIELSGDAATPPATRRALLQALEEALQGR